MAPHPTLHTCSRLRAPQHPHGFPHLDPPKSAPRRAGPLVSHQDWGRQDAVSGIMILVRGRGVLIVNQESRRWVQATGTSTLRRVQLTEQFSTTHPQAHSLPPSNLQVWRLRDQSKHLCSSPGGASPSIWFPAARVRSRGARPNLSLDHSQRMGG